MIVVSSFCLLMNMKEEREDNNDNVIVISSNEMGERNENNDEDENSLSPPAQRDLNYLRKQENSTYSIHLENVHLFQFEFVEIENTKSINNVNYGIYW